MVIDQSRAMSANTPFEVDRRRIRAESSAQIARSGATVPPH